MNDGETPWLALRRRAMAYGIDDGAFWRMSPAALIAITAGMRRNSPGGGRENKRGGGNAGVQRGGRLTDCP